MKAIASIGEVLEELERIVADRAVRRPPGSYTVSLLEAGVEFISRKVGEECVESIVAALAESPERLVEEVADLVYHLTVLLYAKGLSWSDVARVLKARRGGASGKSPHSGSG